MSILSRWTGCLPSRKGASTCGRRTLFLLALWVAVLLSQPLTAAAVGPNFSVQMISPQKFRIYSRQAGPLSTSLVGGGGNQTLITRQENGRAVIEAVIPVGATLHIRVGPHSLSLRMLDRTHYEAVEE